MFLFLADGVGGGGDNRMMMMMMMMMTGCDDDIPPCPFVHYFRREFSKYSGFF